jgi:putative FmdB family regulatory protein
MPTYDYRCTKCGKQFEATHRISDTQPACPACGGACEKLILSPPAAHGYKAVGREQAMRSLQPDTSNKPNHQHGPGCGCGHRH